MALSNQEKIWLARSTFAKKNQPQGKHGGWSAKYTRAQDLLAGCIEYFNWCEDNPLQQDNLVTYKGVTDHEPTYHMRAMTMGHLSVFLGVKLGTLWENYGRGRPDPEMADVVAWASEVIRSYKFQGAAAGLLNPNLIAREIGLVEKGERSDIGLGPNRQEAEESASEKLSGLLDGIAERNG